MKEEMPENNYNKSLTISA